MKITRTIVSRVCSSSMLRVFLMCMVFYVSFIWLNVYAFAILLMVHCRSAFEPGASGILITAPKPVLVAAVLGALAVWIQNQTKNPLGSAPRAVPGYPINCATLLCAPDIMGGLAVWRHNKPKTQNQSVTPYTQCHFIADSDMRFPCWNSQSFHLHSGGGSTFYYTSHVIRWFSPHVHRARPLNGFENGSN
jgi:hypothetical protein